MKAIKKIKQLRKLRKHRKWVIEELKAHNDNMDRKCEDPSQDEQKIFDALNALVNDLEKK